MAIKHSAVKRAEWYPSSPWDTEETILARSRMVEEQIILREIHATRVLEAMREVPRHIFVPRKRRRWAYADCPVLLGFDQTISQPYIVALMTEALGLTGEEKVLEIGTGSGYQAAILSRLARQIYSVERIGDLAHRARAKLIKLGICNVTVIHGNGCLGLAEEAPFDAVIVTASPPDIPEPLVKQLAEGGRLVVPVGERGVQELIKITKRGAAIDTESLGLCNFVPLIGHGAWGNK